MGRLIWPGIYAASVLADLAALALAARGAPELFVPVLVMALKFAGLGAVGVVAAGRGQPLGAVVLAAAALVASHLLAGAALAAGVAPPALARAWIWLSVGPLLAVWLLFLFTFPDGRFAGPGHRRAFVAAASATVLAALAAYAFGPPGLPAWPIRVGPEPPAAPVLGAVPLIGLAALYARYRAASGTARLQIRWVLWGAAVDVLIQIGRAGLRAADLHDAAEALGVASAPVMPLAIAVALRRHRLWEIDLILPRAAAFLLLSVALTAAVAGAGAAAGLLAAGSGLPLGLVVAMVLAVAALAEPARRRIEALVERHLAPGLGGQAALARFMRELERSDSADEVTWRLTESLRRALGASWARLWLAVHTGGGVELRATPQPGDGTAAATAPLGAEQVEVLAAAEPLAAGRVPRMAALLGDERALLLPLVAQSGLVGVVAVGGVRESGDPELLAAFARHAALALRELRLAEELRARLGQIEAQAEALRAAQQRLATAQVAERRRIERDLHDGAQQRLVALAIELARFADQLTDPALRHRALALRTAAEETLAGLQALARGIYPSLLADRGLAAALAALARQQPVATTLEVDEALRTARWRREVEAALYFTAAEAVTNAAKHADARQIAITLEREDGALALEVRDDGRGFDPAAPTVSGAGLRNLRDRAEALGGRLLVDAAPGQGTRVRALFPVGAAASANGHVAGAAAQPVGPSRR